MLLAGNWEWYYPDEGEDSIARHVGYSQPAVSSIQRHAEAMKREAANELSLHRDTGDAHIGVVHMGGADLGHRAKLDSTVYLSAHDEGKKDPLQGKEVPDREDGAVYSNEYRAVMSIEFGHYTSDNGIGPRTRKQHRRTFVKGLGVLQKATKKMVSKRRMSIK
jgi:hypothetical protein